MLGGVIVNILLAVLIYIFILAWWGEKYLPTSEVKFGITVDSLGYEMGLRNGDKIITVGNKQVEEFHKIPAEIIIEEVKTVQVERDGKVQNIDIPKGFLNKLVQHRSSEFIGFRIPFYVGGFSKDSPALAAGIKEKDRIIGINGVSTLYYDEYREKIKESKGREAIIRVVRDADTIDKIVNVSSEGLIGVSIQDPTEFFNLKEKKYSVVQAIPAGTVKTYKEVANYLKQLKLLFSPEVKALNSVGSFISIYDLFPPEWDWYFFWKLTAFLSIMLAVLNVLPIPALDGGHVMFLLYEIIARRKASDKFLEYAQIVGMVLLFSLLIFATYNDIMRKISHLF
jgi:regulator of sigma E protease